MSGLLVGFRFRAIRKAELHFNVIECKQCKADAVGSAHA